MFTPKAQPVSILVLAIILNTSAFSVSSLAGIGVRSSRLTRSSVELSLSRKILRGGGTRPWRDIPLEDGEIGFYHNPSTATSTVMTATDWTKMDDPKLLVTDYPDAQLFQSRLETSDPDIARVLSSELTRQQGQLELIASENIVSKAVLQAQVQNEPEPNRGRSPARRRPHLATQTLRAVARALTRGRTRASPPSPRGPPRRARC